MKLKLSLIICAAVAALCGVARANDAPAIAAFDRAFSAVNDYTCVLHVHEAKGSETQDRVYQYEFMKPHFVKTLILQGDGKGSGGVWTGGDQVSGHQGGFLSGIHMKVSVHDGRAVSLRGVTIPESLLQNRVDSYASIPGKLTETAGGKIDGVETERLELKVADPAANHGVSQQIMYFNRETHWPIRQIMYDGSQIVLDETITDLKTNVGLKQSDFPF